VSNSNDPNLPGAQPPRQSEVRIRRAPKMTAFLIVGGGLGAIITFVLTALFPVDPEVGFFALFGYLALYGVTAGVVVGGVIAIILDRRADKNTTSGSAVVESAPPAQEPELPAVSERASESRPDVRPDAQPDRGPEPPA
jgi:hypothetical protein